MKQLPVIESYAFPVTLPSTNQSITIRPFLVKEEKLLLLAQESQDSKDQIEAVAQVVRNCTNNEVDPKTTPYFDTEYLLVQLRARSVGEQITPTFRCNTPLSEGTTPEGNSATCGHNTTVPINLFEVNVEFPDSLPEKTVELSTQFTLHLRYPTIYTIEGLLNAVTGTSVAFDAVAKNLSDVLHLLEDKANNITYAFDEYTTEEKTTFLHGLRTEQYQKIVNFATVLPTVTYATTYTCAKCNHTHRVQLSGLADFLG